ncbi:uncharacterized protein BX663DRAFT_182043 [Cokeromyces recurvatus]|uniref:uncharacterized protein n=1 Tax=Cokeromyces recurvatus TaxID=90255 RepID=UPI002220287C|nr:uncharacterized protein BX663DRAFT_182043 [Cokeromyces recurvatus]KAI7899755.1 hypothetical protein BX663DRAFT_182043 [Cokeromyces recurvatus]
MSLFYGEQDSLEYRQYSNQDCTLIKDNFYRPTTTFTVLQFLKNEKIHNKNPFPSSPPSYTAVLAEKYQQAWDKELTKEANKLLNYMKKSIQDIQFMIDIYQCSCQKLIIKHNYLLTRLKKEIDSVFNMHIIVTLYIHTHIYIHFIFYYYYYYYYYFLI